MYQDDYGRRKAIVSLITIPVTQQGPNKMSLTTCRDILFQQKYCIFFKTCSQAL